MTRYRAIWDKSGFKAEIENDEVKFWRDDEPVKGSDLPSPSLISDHHEPFKSMADGKIYDSKSAYRTSLKRHGMRELGNDAPLTAAPPVVKSTRREVLTKRLADMSDKQANKILKTLKKGNLP